MHGLLLGLFLLDGAQDDGRMEQTRKSSCRKVRYM